MKRFVALFLLMFATFCSAQNTALVGTFSGPSGSPPFNGVLQLQLYMPGAVRAVVGCGGSSDEYILPVQISITITAGGLVAAPNVWGADCLEPVGIPYKVTIRDNNGNIIVADYWLIQGTVFDIGQAQSAAPSVPSWTQQTMVYPTAGIPQSTGTGWGTSYTTTGFGSSLMLSSDPTYTGTLRGPNAALTGTFSAIGSVTFGGTSPAPTSLVSVLSAAFGGSPATAASLTLQPPTGATTNYFINALNGVTQEAYLDALGNFGANQIFDAGLTPGNCVQATTGGKLTTVAFPCGAGGGGGTGNTTSTSLTNNFLPKANGANSIINSSVADNGTAVSTVEDIIANSFRTSGSTVNGFLTLASLGVLPATPAAGSIQLTTPNAVTAYQMQLPGTIPPDATHIYWTCTPTAPTVCGWSDNNGGTSISASWTVNTGLPATPAATYFVAPVTGTVSNCYFTTTTSDGSTNLVFNVKRAGTDIITGTNATVTAGTSAGTVSTFTLTSGTVAVTQGDTWEFDITTGTASWTGVAQCY